MPLYDYKCQKGHKFEKVYSLKEYDQGPVPVCPVCGEEETRRVMVIGHGGIQCDSGNDVKWLDSSVIEALQDTDEIAHGREKPIETRTEWKNYLKKNNIVAAG